ncbi:MAG TPA: glycerate kinase [Casimicrobiaceae bacterium]|jgi:glycerate kinase|nr:glycerate kinase [Casimicrobiaceae bacterium]
MRAHPPVIVIAPDSFKGSVAASDGASAIAEGLRRVWPDADLRLCPMADGGEGTLDAVLSRGGQRLTARVAGAADKTVEAGYGIVGEGKIAIIEAAQIVGLTDPDGTAIDVERRSTRGVGELMAKLLDAGLLEFMVGLGGTSTNDAGAGMLAALGLRLLDAKGRAVHATPEGLANLATVDAEGFDPRLRRATITIMSDVDNVLAGPRGATATFGPQKGVRPERIGELDAGLARFAALVEKALGKTARDRPGAGAAGGLGFALQLLGGEVRFGAEVVADLIGLDAAIQGADWVITGEGRTDAQTLLGKTPLIVARRGAAVGIPTTLISGGIDRTALPELSRHFAGCFSLADGPMTLEDCVANAARLLADRAEQAGRLYAAGRGAGAA